MNDHCSLSVVIAVEADGNSLAMLRTALAPERHPDVDFIYVFAAAPTRGTDSHLAENEREVASRAGGLVPQLWAAGMHAARGDWVATTTTQFVPEPSWIDQLVARQASAAAAIGGVFSNAPGARPIDWAVFLLRYAAYAAPQRTAHVEHVAADNAMYRRSLVLEQRDLLAEGFWEPSFHTRFRAAGLALELDPALGTVLHNRYTARRFFHLRAEHGRRFGRARAARRGWPGRLAWLLASPLLPAVFLAKVVRRARAHPVCAPHVLPALAWMAFFLAGWGIGEARGYLDSLTGNTQR